MARRDEPVLDAELLAQAVEHVCAAGFLLLAAGREAVGELAAIIGQELDDLDGPGLVDLGEDVDTAAIGLVAIELDEDSACSAVDRNEQIAPCRLVRHLRQVLDVDVHKARLVVFEGLFRGGYSAFLLDQVTQIRDAVAAQVASHAGTRNGGIDELARDRQQVVRGQ